MTDEQYSKLLRSVVEKFLLISGEELFGTFKFSELAVTKRHSLLQALEIVCKYFRMNMAITEIQNENKELNESEIVSLVNEFLGFEVGN